MSEKINSNSYLLPTEFMEPQRPVAPENYSVTSRMNIQDAELRSIPDALTPLYLASDTNERVVKGGEGSEFRALQDAAYVEREKNRNEWIERELGGVAVGAAIVATESSSEMSTVGSLERESSQETGLDVKSVEDLVRTLRHGNESNRNLPAAEGRHNLSAFIAKKVNGAYDAFKTGKISQESYSVIASALLGAASSNDSISAVVDKLRGAETLDVDEVANLSLYAGTIGEIASLAGLEAERARISFANSLIAKSERLLNDNDNVATSRYRAMVGLIAGLSTQITDPATSNGFVSGALGRLKQHS